jgi:hypothetical protein
MINDLSQTHDSQEEVSIPTIGEFKTKRKFISFVSAVNGAKVRLLRNTAFLKAEKLSGVLEGIKFKITICDESTINFEEVDTNQVDRDMITRLIDDIDSMNVTGYAQKFIISGLEFRDSDDLVCYLEVEHEKPIDRFSNLIDSLREERDQVEEQTRNLSNRGLFILDTLFNDSDVSEEEFIEAIEASYESNIQDDLETDNKSVNAQSYMEESFKKMNDDKVNELKKRIEDSKNDIIKYRNDISFAEKKLDEVNNGLQILNSRLDTMVSNDDLNGWVFFVSEQQKNDVGIDENTREIADKIADLMNLKKDVLFDYLTGGFYKIKIAKSDSQEFTDIPKEILQKMEFDPMGKMVMNSIGEFEYRGNMTWHQLVGKMLRNGFAQDPQFDKICNSNSYDSKWGESEEIN